jgi:hypothetical protein
MKIIDLIARTAGLEVSAVVLYYFPFERDIYCWSIKYHDLVSLYLQFLTCNMRLTLHEATDSAASTYLLPRLAQCLLNGRPLHTKEKQSWAPNLQFSVSTLHIWLEDNKFYIFVQRESTMRVTIRIFFFWYGYQLPLLSSQKLWFRILFNNKTTSSGYLQAMFTTDWMEMCSYLSKILT